MIDVSELDALEAQLRGGLVDDAIADAAGPAIADMAAAAQRRIRNQARPHRRTGRLEAGIVVDVDGRGLETTARVTARGVANIIVGGQRPHPIRPLHGRVLAFGSPPAGFAASVMHPGTAPDPFVARGLAAAAGELGAIADDAAHDMAAQVAARLEG